MCGFVGEVAADGRLQGLDRATLNRARRFVDHRGPDAQGLTWRPEDGVCLAFARLRIIDLSKAADQPMWTADGRVGVVFNGEIYNFRKLRTELESKGRKFHAESDTEVLLQSYLEWGDACLSRLVGMWGLVFIDLRAASPRLLLSRDRMGEKPLFWLWDEAKRQLAFGSELPAVVSLTKRSGPPEIDRSALRSYLTLGYVPSPRSIIVGVSKVEPGSAIILEPGAERPRSWRWWSPPSPTDAVAPTAGTVREVVERAVDRRRISDVPIGVLLSGGIDSTIVAGLLAKRGPVKTFCAAYDIGPRSFKYNVDADVAERVAVGFGTDHTRFELQMTSNLSGKLQAMVETLGEPHANPTALASMLLAREVKNAGVTVVLTGDGSDELFGGYDRYRKERWVRWARTLGPVGRAAAKAPLPSSFEKGARSLAERAALQPRSSESYLSWWRTFPDDRLFDVLISKDRSDQLEPAESLAEDLEALGDVRDEDAIAAMDLRWWIPDESNARVDHTMMYAAIEARAVFEDHDLVETVGASRMSAKVGRIAWRKKAVLVDAFQDLLPQEVRERRKWGWFSPVHYWVNEALWDDLAEIVRWLPDTGLFTPAVRSYIEIERPTQDPQAVWTLAIFGLWYRWFFDTVVV